MSTASTTTTAQEARRLLREHNLVGWTFQLSRGKRKMGNCNYTRRVITVSEHLVRLNTSERVQQTLLHEVAHAITYERHGETGHGPTWRRIARDLGHSGDRCSSEENTVLAPAPWSLVCPGCGTKVPRHRRPTRKLGACKDCCTKHSGGRYDPRFIFQLERNR